jgi:glycosyltransferase involved in cell wall biosynthesis
VEAHRRELEGALERESATREILEVLGRCAFELEPVFETVLAQAVRLCRADAGLIYVLEGDAYRVEVALGASQAYRDYIRRSRGEFACAKPSCMRFQNAWVSDRTLCYLASGRPVVVQDTGPSRLLPNGEGMFRFNTPEQAAAALESMNADYPRHCRAARELAEAVFDARLIAARILEVAAS